MFVLFTFFSSYLISSLIALWLEKVLDMISILLNLLRLHLWPKMWSILDSVPCALEEKVHSSAFGWNVLKISMRSISSNVSFKTCVSLLIFYFDDLSIGVSEVLKSPTVIMLLSISPFTSVSVSLMYWGAPVLGAEMFTIVMSSSWIDPLIFIYCPFLSLVIFFILRSILSDMRIATPAFFCLPFVWSIFFPSSHFQSTCVFRSEVGFL